MVVAPPGRCHSAKWAAVALTSHLVSRGVLACLVQDLRKRLRVGFVKLQRAKPTAKEVLHPSGRESGRALANDVPVATEGHSAPRADGVAPRGNANPQPARKLDLIADADCFAHAFRIGSTGRLRRVARLAAVLCVMFANVSRQSGLAAVAAAPNSEGSRRRNTATRTCARLRAVDFARQTLVGRWASSKACSRFP
jgi:hypothetical protein